MRYKASLAVAACAAATLGLAACGSSGGSSASSGTSSSPQILTMESSPAGGPVPDIFNPFSTQLSASNTLGLTDMIYEPLLQFNDLKPGTWYPWLATSYSWSNGGKTITFPIRAGVKFTDGESFNANMAAWEFNFLKAHADINTNGLPIVSASAPNATTLTVTFSSPQYTNLYNIADTPMIPEGIWSKQSDPGKYADTNPVGTGPYTLKTFSPQGVLLTRNTKYWQGESHVPELDFPAYTSNTTANAALEDGSLQWAGNFVQNIQSDFVSKSPNYHYWDFGLQTETLIPNLTTFPFSGPGGLAVREAISDGLNRNVISADGEGGEQPPAVGAGSLTGITIPLDNQYITPAVSQYATTYDPSKAEQILKAAGWTMGSNGYFQKGGKTLAFTVEDPAAYSDFDADDDIMQQQLKAVGIEVTVKQTSIAEWDADLADGNFNSMAHWGNGGISPYNMYQNWLDTSLYTATPKAATGDYERFTGPVANQADALLNAYAATNSAAQQTQDVVGLEKIIAQNLPVIPLFYGVAWFDYNDSQWTGWPSPSNEYAPGEPAQPFNEIVVLRLRPKS